jgi:DNA-binding CsgD family transcriptional regulator
LLERAAADPDHAVARAHLALFDARVAQRAGNAAAAKTFARDAAGRFASIGWPWEQAQALEIAGRFADAGQLYSRHGYARDERRLAEARRRLRHRAGADRLTPRESEVARLAVEGKSNREIADILAISERTVETHIAAVFDRFDLSSRRELSRVLE